MLAQLPDQGAAIGPYFGLLFFNNGTAIFLVSWLFISQFRQGLKKAWVKRFKGQVAPTVVVATSTMARKSQHQLDRSSQLKRVITVTATRL